MKSLFAIICFLACGIVSAQTTKTISAGQTITTLMLSWTAPTANTDGSAITGAITYNTYWGTSCVVPLTNKMNSAPLTTLNYLVTNVGPGLKCFAVTSIVNGVESVQTADVAITVLPAPPVVIAPKAPTNVAVK